MASYIPDFLGSLGLVDPSSSPPSDQQMRAGSPRSTPPRSPPPPPPPLLRRLGIPPIHSPSCSTQPFKHGVAQPGGDAADEPPARIRRTEGGREGGACPFPRSAPPIPYHPAAAAAPPLAAAAARSCAHPHGRASGGTWRGRRPLRRSTEGHSATPGGWRRCSARVVLARSRCALPRVHCTSLSSRPGRPAGAAPVRLTAQTRRQRLGSEQARAIGSGPAARRHLTTLR